MGESLHSANAQAIEKGAILVQYMTYTYHRTKHHPLFNSPRNGGWISEPLQLEPPLYVHCC
ncbi:unnamed protein product [Ilex paraguariensis]|uniref:Uncharacterized protein n=1 Tax=Ilex paraguariensis TaxID=185542 RepID=A0ABC8TNG3_9AQUA